MKSYHTAVANIIGGVLHSSNRLMPLINTLIKYFQSEDTDFDGEEFKRIALNGDYTPSIEEEPVETPNPNT